MVKYSAAAVYAAATVHLERMAWAAILDRFNWCGTPELQRMAYAHLYLFLFAPTILVVLFLYRKRQSREDVVLRICGLVFLAALMLYVGAEQTG